LVGAIVATFMMIYQIFKTNFIYCYRLVIAERLVICCLSNSFSS
jgi:hypothetical protein